MYPRKGARGRSLIVSLLIFLTLGMTSMARGQYIRACETTSPLSSRGAGSAAAVPAPPSQRGGSFEVTPSLCVSERYDTNVFFVPPTPGLKPQDFVTNVTPKLHVNYNGEFASGVLDLAGFGETYVRNPDLNYIGGRSYLSLNLDNSLKRLLPKASLRIVDSFVYTPLPPGFASLAAGTSPSDPANVQNIYAMGFLALRTNNLINNATVSTKYATTASTSLEASYSNSILRWGSSPVTSAAGAQSGLLDTTTQNGIVGGSAELSGLDRVSARYSYTAIEYGEAVSTSGSPLSFNTQTATIGWSRTLTQSLRAEIAGGGIVVGPGPASPGLTTWAANAALTMNSQNSRATIAYSRSAFPSIVGEPVVLVGDMVSLSAIQTIDQHWQIAEAANYAHSSGGEAPSKLVFDTYSASLDINYWITRIWSTALSYDYMKFNQELGATKLEIDRQVITLTLRASWS